MTLAQGLFVCPALIPDEKIHDWVAAKMMQVYCLVKRATSDEF